MTERIVFLDRSAIRTELRPPHFAHTWQEYPHTPADEVVSRLQGATIAVTNRTRIGSEALAQLPALRLVAVAATGTDCVDVTACRERGVAVTNVRDWAVSVPEHVFALTLALRRQLMPYHEAVMRGDWGRAAHYAILREPLPRALKGSTLGIVGYGALGQTVAQSGHAFGMNVLVAEHKGADTERAGRTRFETVLTASDVLVLLCPLTEQTRGLIGAAELAQMRPDALLINCARGGIVDEAALADALKTGRIGGAGIDVLAEEPPRSGSPLLNSDLPNLLVTPHVAWASRESLAELAEQLIGTLEAFVAGNPRNLVTP